MAESIILFGGGLDSGAMVEMLTMAGARPTLLFFTYRQKAAVGERMALRYFSRKYNLPTKEVAIPDGIMPDSPLTTQARVSNHSLNYLAGRNMVFAALAFPLAVRLGAERMYLGASPADESSVYLDAKPAFADAFNLMVRTGYGEGSPRLHMPLVNLKRVEYLRSAMRREPDLFRVTFSCYESNTEKECGLCTHCQIKAQMLREVRG